MPLLSPDPRAWGQEKNSYVITTEWNDRERGIILHEGASSKGYCGTKTAQETAEWHG